MAISDVKLPKKYKNGQLLYEENLDDWRKTAETAFAAMKKNFLQIAKDSFSVGYDYKNNGVAQKTVSLEDRLNQFTAGTSPFPGTISDTFTINSDGFSATLDTSLLTANHSYQFPNASGTLALTSDITAAINTYVPIGMEISFNDMNGALTFDSTKWAYCNGQTVTVTGVGATALRDLSNRYFVGFGTEGGADLGSAAWSTSPVGNASHQIDIRHSHTVNSHTHTGAAHVHDLSSHTHTGAAHTHSAGSLLFPVSIYFPPSFGGVLKLYDSGGTGNITPFDSTTISYTAGGVSIDVMTPHGGIGALDTYTDSGSGATGSTAPGAGGTPSNNNSGSTTPGIGGAATPGTDSQLSATQSIQPRSIRTRFIMRYA